MEHGIRIMDRDRLETAMRKAFKRGMRGTAEACLRELNRRARRDQVEIIYPERAA